MNTGELISPFEGMANERVTDLTPPFPPSQGAQIMDDAFCGGPDGNSLKTNQTTLVPAATAQKVAALVFMGDPRHVGGEAFNAGNATAGGVSHERPLSARTPPGEGWDTGYLVRFPSLVAQIGRPRRCLDD